MLKFGLLDAILILLTENIDRILIKETLWTLSNITNQNNSIEIVDKVASKGIYQIVLNILIFAFNQDKNEKIKHILINGLYFFTYSILLGMGVLKMGLNESDVIDILLLGLVENKNNYDLVIDLLKSLVEYIDREKDISNYKNISVIKIILQSKFYPIINEMYNNTKDKEILEFTGQILNEVEGKMDENF